MTNYGINIACLILINKEKKSASCKYMYLFSKASVETTLLNGCVHIVINIYLRITEFQNPVPSGSYSRL